MGKAYPKDIKAKFKARVMDLVQKDYTFKEIAEEVGIASSFAFQLAWEGREYKSDLVEKIRCLRYQEKMTFKKIAKKLGIGATTVRTVLLRSKEEEELEVQREIMRVSGKKGAEARWGKGEKEKRKQVLKMRQSFERTMEKRRKVIEKEEVEAPGPVRAVGYLRVSTEEQAKKGISLDAQEKSIFSFIEAKGWKLVECVRDPGFSGKNMNRPGLQKIIKLCKSNGVDVVVVYKLDRLSRRMRDMLELVDDVFEKNGIDLACVTETIDTSTAMGRTFFWIITILAQLERERIGERVSDARTFRDNKGEWTGRTPYGYELAYVNGKRIKGKLRMDESKMKLYEQAKDLWRKGVGVRSISAKLGVKYGLANRLVCTDVKALNKRMNKYLVKS